MGYCGATSSRTARRADPSSRAGAHSFDLCKERCYAALADDRQEARMRIPGTWMVLLIAFVALRVGAPGPVAACDCCACDFGEGDIECGDWDVDCVECIEEDGWPADDCSVCDGVDACAGDTLCDDDTQECFGAPTRTPTVTPTGTPTNTPASLGAACSAPSECQSGFCASGVCCNTACDQPSQQCYLPGRAGLCSSTAAPAPAMSTPGLLLGALLLTGVGVLALARRRITSSGERFR